MIHPRTVVAPGGGVRTTAALPRGSFVWIRDPLDLVLGPEQFARLSPFWIQRLSSMVLPTRDTWVHPWDHAQSFGRARLANCAGSGVGVLVTLRAVDAGEALTVPELPDGPWTLRCACGRGVAPGRGACEGDEHLRLKAALLASAGVRQELPSRVVWDVRPEALAAACG